MSNPEPHTLLDAHSGCCNSFASLGFVCVLVGLVLSSAACVTNDVPDAANASTRDMAGEDAGLDMGADEGDASDDLDAQMDAATPDAGEDLGGDLGRDAGEDAGGADMPDATPLDMTPDEGIDMPRQCEPACGASERCEDGACVDVCVMAGVSCGEVEGEDGVSYQCGGCQVATEACVAGACVDLCQEARAECGDELSWSGQEVSCGECMNLSDRCTQGVCHSAAAGWVQVATGRSHSCGVRTDGKLWCWGSNAKGQLGRTSAGDGSQLPVETMNLGAVEKVDITDQHSCVVDIAGFAWCWGDNGFGQIGNGQTSVRSSPYRVTSLSDVADVSVGSWHTCARLSGGEVRCVGYGLQGQIGDGSTNNSTSFRAIRAGGSSFFDLSLGTAHGCAVAQGGGVKCWGFNGDEMRYGRLGVGDTQSRAIPTEVDVELAEARFHQVSSGETHACAVSQSHEVWCWGDNTFGQLGDGSAVDRLSPIRVAVPGEVRSVHAGKSHTCAVTFTDTLYCWGRNEDGQLGLGHAIVQRTPQALPLDEVLSASAGFYHTCAVTRGGELYCWGKNDEGQLGLGDLTSRNQPAKVTN